MTPKRSPAPMNAPPHPARCPSATACTTCRLEHASGSAACAVSPTAARFAPAASSRSRLVPRRRSRAGRLRAHRRRRRDRPSLLPRSAHARGRRAGARQLRRACGKASAGARLLRAPHRPHVSAAEEPASSVSAPSKTASPRPSCSTAPRRAALVRPLRQRQTASLSEVAGSARQSASLLYFPEPPAKYPRRWLLAPRSCGCGATAIYVEREGALSTV